MAADAPRTVREVIRFVLPPSLGEEIAGGRARRLDDFFSQQIGRPTEVSVAANYEVLTRELLAGRIDAAWAPPFVCARVESMGARVLVRSVRHGASTYRAALVCREDRPVSLGQLSGKRAAWVDLNSVAGFLLPVAFLKSQELDPAKTFFSQEFAGSYRGAVDAVAAGRADVASVFAPAKRQGRADVTGLDEIAPDLASRFRVIAFTEEAPNDGIAVSPVADASALLALERVLLTLAETPEGAAILRDTFNAEAFEPAPRMGYRALYRVALSTL